MNYENYNLKKGDQVKFTFIYPKGHADEGAKEFKGIFSKYLIVNDKRFVLKFGPRNFKKASYIIAEVIYTNEYGVKIKFPVTEIESIEKIS